MEYEIKFRSTSARFDNEIRLSFLIGPEGNENGFVLATRHDPCDEEEIPNCFSMTKQELEDFIKILTVMKDRLP